MEILILILFVRELFTRRNFKLHIVSRRKTSLFPPPPPPPVYSHDRLFVAVRRIQRSRPVSKNYLNRKHGCK